MPLYCIALPGGVRELNQGNLRAGKVADLAAPARGAARRGRDGAAYGYRRRLWKRDRWATDGSVSRNASPTSVRAGKCHSLGPSSCLIHRTAEKMPCRHVPRRLPRPSPQHRGDGRRGEQSSGALDGYWHPPGRVSGSCPNWEDYLLPGDHHLADRRRQDRRKQNHPGLYGLDATVRCGAYTQAGPNSTPIERVRTDHTRFHTNFVRPS